MHETVVRPNSHLEERDRALIVAPHVFHSYAEHPHPVGLNIGEFVLSNQDPVVAIIRDASEAPASEQPLSAEPAPARATIALEGTTESIEPNESSSDPFPEDFDHTKTGEDVLDLDNEAEETVSKRRIGWNILGRAKEIYYSAGAAMTQISRRNKVLGGLATVGAIYTSYKVFGNIDHSSALDAHSSTAGSLDHGSLHTPAAAGTGSHGSHSFVAEVNGDKVNHPATSHFVGEVNGKAVPKSLYDVHPIHGHQAAHHLAQHLSHLSTPPEATLHSGDNPWTVSEHVLRLPTHGHLTPHQLHQIWAYDQHLQHLNHIMNEDQAEHLAVGTKLKLPKY